MRLIDSFEKMLASGTDNPLLRFSLGHEYHKDGHHAAAIAHLQVAVTLDPNYSAAWKLLGKSLAASGDDAAARVAYTRGIEVANKKGDKQAAKEMMVFLRRLKTA